MTVMTMSMGLKFFLKQALLKRGLPRRPYCDHGKVFRRRLILLLAARLGIQLSDSHPFKPEGCAKIERFFRRVRTAFLVRVDPDRVGDLDEFNRLFAAWLEGEYHVTPHRGIDDETPLDRWMRPAGGIRSLPPGTGKSTLLWALIDSLAKTTHSVCLVDDTNCPLSELFRLIARGFHLEPRFKKSDVIQDIKERIVKLSQVQKVRPVLVLDDAQRLPSPFLDELRGLTSFDGDRRDELTLILAGHPHLEAGLKLAINEPLAQRIILRVRLRSLYPEEVDLYVAARLRMAGRTARLFSPPEAVEAAAKASRGAPRVIDRIGEHCLLIALRSNRKEVDSQIVSEAIDEVDA